MKPVAKTIRIIIFAIAMGYLESAVVVYLRALYYPEGFAFPLKALAPDLITTELFREVATLFMLVAIGSLAARERLHRFAWFLAVFAIWDITYYIFLKLLLGWPESLLTNDILFLLPSLWTGPVIAPVINSISMIILAAVILSPPKGSAPVTRLTRWEIMLLIAGSVIVLIAYMKDYAGYAWNYKQNMQHGEFSWKQFMTVVPEQFIPRGFDWLLFCSGVFLHLLAILLIFKRYSPVKVTSSGAENLTDGQI